MTFAFRHHRLELHTARLPTRDQIDHGSWLIRSHDAVADKNAGLLDAAVIERDKFHLPVPAIIG
jgi:hypothetical protein